MLLYWIFGVISRLINQVALNHPLNEIANEDRLASLHWVIILYIIHFNLVFINRV